MCTLLNLTHYNIFMITFNTVRWKNINLQNAPDISKPQEYNHYNILINTKFTL